MQNTSGDNANEEFLELPNIYSSYIQTLKTKKELKEQLKTWKFLKKFLTENNMQEISGQDREIKFVRNNDYEQIYALRVGKNIYYILVNNSANQFNNLEEEFKTMIAISRIKYVKNKPVCYHFNPEFKRELIVMPYIMKDKDFEKMSFEQQLLKLKEECEYMNKKSRYQEYMEEL